MHYPSFSLVFVLISQMIFCERALAGSCDLWMSGPLHNQPQGVNAAGFIAITASAVWSPTTGGTFLVVGGLFTSAGGVPANNIAMWDGASWRALDTGVDGIVKALAVYNGDLIAGGQFTQAGSEPANFIARFDGTSWHAMGNGFVEKGSNSISGCFALAVFENDLIAGGKFDQSGNTPLINIARWNGSTWSAVGNPSPPFCGVGVVGQSDFVQGLRVHNSALYIGGSFQIAGGNIGANNITRFVNGAYAPLGSGTLGSIAALQSFGADLVAGGSFIQAGGLSAKRVARWTPGAGSSGTWSAMGSGFGGGSDFIAGLQPFNGQLIACGQFPGSVSVWNGSAWSTLGGGVSGGNYALALNVFDSQLTAGGNFSLANGVPATNIAQWSGSFWSALQTPVPEVLAFEKLAGRFIAAGSFLQSTTNQTPAHNIIGWTGATLTQVENGICCGEGTNGTIRALKSYAGGGADLLLVGGDFTVAGGVSANRIAQYSQPFFTPATWETLGVGFNNGSVNAIERFNGATYAGGSFTASGLNAVSRIARFDRTNWVALGSGLNGPVNAMKVFNGELYAGGDFSTAGGANTGGLARWNGMSWSHVGVNLTGSFDVFALEVHNNELIIGGSFNNGPTGSFNIVRWNGSTYSGIGTGPNAPVNALKSDGAHVYALGGFTTVGGVNVNHVARWNVNDGWSDVSGGTSDVVNTLGLFHGEIQVGLGISFEGVAARGGSAPQPGNGWVRYSPTGDVWIELNPSGQTVNCGDTATFTSSPAPGYSLLLATWRKNGVALNDGPSPQGSTISGAHADTLVISNAKAADAGSYDCMFGNVCGGATSSAAILTVNDCCSPDVTGNDFVDVDDLLIVINNWGTCPAPPAQCVADLAPPGGNGVVDVDDLLIIVNGWGACP